jgi:hypothetical protein
VAGVYVGRAAASGAARGAAAAASRRAVTGAARVWAWARLLGLRVYQPMLAAFLVGSPFVVLDPGHFLHDFLRQNRIMARGWLGFENTGNGLWYNLHVNLGGTLGAVLLVLALAGLVWALWRHTLLDLMVAPYAILYVAYISTWKELADRYLLPVVPLLILLAVRLCLELAEARPSWRKVAVPAVAALFAAAIVTPLAASLAFDRELSGTDTRTQATAWIAGNLPAGSVVALETSGPQLVRQRELKYYAAAGRRPAAFRVIRLPLPAPDIADRSHDLAWLRERNVDYVVVSSKVYDRVLAAAEHYPGVAAFYRQLDEQATLVRTFVPGPGDPGPTLKLYRL